jgi:hypothetical protein
MTDLLPLPEPDTHCWDDDTGKDVWSYSADQMRAYALAERERCARAVEQYGGAWDKAAQSFARVIRGTP